MFAKSGNELNLNIMCAHHQIGFRPNVKGDIMGWNVAGAKMAERWQGESAHASASHPPWPLGSLTINTLNRNSMASVPMLPKDLC